MSTLFERPGDWNTCQLGSGDSLIYSHRDQIAKAVVKNDQHALLFVEWQYARGVSMLDPSFFSFHVAKFCMDNAVDFTTYFT